MIYGELKKHSCSVGTKRNGPLVIIPTARTALVIRNEPLSSSLRDIGYDVSDRVPCSRVLSGRQSLRHARSTARPDRVKLSLIDAFRA